MELIRNNRGFSLLELLIVITLIIAMSGFAVTSIIDNLPGYRLGGAARRVMTDLMLARMQAVSNNANATVTFASGRYTFGGSTVVIGSEFKGVSLSSSGNVTFMPMGISSGAVTVTLTGKAGLPAKYVDVSTAGRVRIR